MPPTAAVIGVAALLSMLFGATAQLRGLLANQTCHTQKIDKYFYFVVNNVMCNGFQPGNASLRGPTAGFPQVSECILVNNSMPGPTIRVNLGDWVQVDIKSMLFGRPVSFHWHGLFMEETPWVDGASMVSACPLLPQQAQSYVWHATQVGTFFYHGHHGLEEEYGMSGAIIIDDPQDPYTDLYDEEFPGQTLDIRDWWRQPDAHTDQATAFRFYQVMSPQGYPLINGYWGGPGDVNTPAYPLPVFPLAVNTCYRTRWILGNTEWPGWKMNLTDPSGNAVNQTLFSLTAQYLQPKNTYNFDLYIAQRAETVFCTAGPGDYHLTMDTAQPENNTYCATAPSCNFTAIFRVGGINTTMPKVANRAKLAGFPWYQEIDSLKHPELIVPLTPINVPLRASQTWMIYIAIIAGNMYAWTERNWGNVMPTAPLLFTKGGQCGTAPQWVPGQNISNVQKGYLQKTVQKGEVVDIIFNNLSPFMHPFHLHGQDFQVLGSKYIVDAGYTNTPSQTCPTGYMWANPAWDQAQGPPWGANVNNQPFAHGCPYNASQDNSQYFLTNPYHTDIVPVPAHSWAYTRVTFDNPGAWFLHCHLNIHMLSGMGFFVNTALDQVPKIPSWVDTSCGGSCQPLTQLCGAYSPTTANTVKCSTNVGDNVCLPVFGGPGTTGYSG